MITPHMLRQEAGKISDRDLDLAYECSDSAWECVDSQGPFERIKEDVKHLMSMFTDYKKGIYDRLPWCSITLIAASILYVVNPLDLIPDIAPVIGFIDDAGVLGLCMKSLESDLAAYRSWTCSFYYRHLQNKLARGFQVETARLPAGRLALPAPA